jgi:hypothetical protein
MLVEKEVTMQEIVDVLDMNVAKAEAYDISGYGLEVESFNVTTGMNEYKPVTEVLVKEKVSRHYLLGNLRGSANHRVLDEFDEYIELQYHPQAILVNEPISIVDISVEDNQNYIAYGEVNHNTTSGGK